MTESSIDFPKETLCLDVWEKDIDASGTKEVWQLKQDVFEKIIQIHSVACPEAKTVHVVGSITSNQYSETSDVDVHFLDVGIEFNDSMQLEEYRKQLQEKYKDKLYAGAHPIEVYFQDNKFQDMMSVGCYDVLKKSWIVGPELNDQTFNPYSEYYADIQKQAKKYADKIRIQILKTYEDAVLYVNNFGKSTEKLFKDQFLKSVDEASKLYSSVKASRKVASAPSSYEDAMKKRSDRKWKIADASFKLFDKFGYLAILRQIFQLNELLKLSDSVSEEVATKTIDAVKMFLGNEDSISESCQIDEGAKQAISQFALALALLIPGIATAKTINSAKSVLRPNMTVVQKKQNKFIQLLKGHDPNKMMNGYKMWQALNILALTLYGEGRSEIKAGGLDPITDSILNRTAVEPDISRVANICVGRKEGKAFQYSFWNDNKYALQTIKNGSPVLPKQIRDNVLEKRAWETCLSRAVEVIAGKYKIKDRKINSYHVYPTNDPPSWSDEMTNVRYVGNHKFGYVASNDPAVMDLTSMTPIKKIKKFDIAKDKSSDKVYIVKKNDSLWKIAKDYNTTVKNIASKNNIDANGIIKPGQKLKI